MNTAVITTKQDLTYLKWAHARNSSGTAGTFLKSESTLNKRKLYYKLSNYDSVKGIIGHECINEIVIDRLLTLFNIEHLHYQLIHADVEIMDRTIDTYLCCSEDFKKIGESKWAFDDYFEQNRYENESAYEFCQRQGWSDYIDTMLAIDYIIANRDRHGANIEILKNARKKTLRIAPLFDHGLSLFFSCNTEKEIEDFDIQKTILANNYIGSRDSKENLSLIKTKNPNIRILTDEDRDYLFADLKEIITENHMDKIFNLLNERITYYETL